MFGPLDFGDAAGALDRARSARDVPDLLSLRTNEAEERRGEGSIDSSPNSVGFWNS